ncbi:MAG: ABC transporter substrate-binding protein [Spirochaetales bacterium]|nr:ABC transporter substrate-binding protein [Spirochaetales bacterium]
MKRMLPKALMLALVAMLCLSPVMAQKNQPDVFKIGFLSSLTGSLAGLAEGQRKSFILSVEQVNATGGLKMPWGNVKVETFIADDETKLDVGVRRFREMLDKGALAVTGGIWNPMSGALNEETKISSVIYLPGFVPAKDALLKGNPAEAMYTPTFTPWSIGYIAARSIVQTMGKKSIFYVERADSWGTTIREGIEAACKDFGAVLVGKDAVNIGTTDYSSVLSKAKASGADFLVNSLTGADGIALVKQAIDMGVDKEMDIFYCWLSNTESRGFPPQTLAKLYGQTWFYYDVGGLVDKELVSSIKEYSDAYMKRWNEPPDNMGTACYVATQYIFQAAERAGSFNPKDVAKVLATGTFNTVKGPASFRIDHQPIAKNVLFILKGKTPEERKNEFDWYHVLETYGGEEVLPPLSVMKY